MRYVVCFNCEKTLPVLIVVEGARITCKECGSVIKLVYRDGQIMATEADKDTSPKVLIPGVIKLTPERLQFIDSNKPCFKDYDENELSCQECDDRDLCKERTPRVKVGRK